MRSSSGNVVLGQLGWQGIRSDPATTSGLSTSKLDEDHRDSRRIGKEDDAECWMLKGGCFPLLIDVIEVKKVLKGLGSPLFGVHG
ncbi:unnamed protein product [Caenorhabditis nigoni]